MSSSLAPPSTRRKEVVRPNLGLYLDRPARSIPDRAMQDCLNVRIQNGAIKNVNMGWEKFYANQLNGQVLLIDTFTQRNGSQSLIFGTQFDLYKWNDSTNKPEFLSVLYNGATVQVNNGSAQMDWPSGQFITNNIKVGDWIHVGATNQRDPEAVWYKIATVVSETEIRVSPAYVGTTDTLPTTIRRTFTGTVNDGWDSSTFIDSLPGNVDLWFGTNGTSGGLVKWDGSATEVTVMSPGFFCKKLDVHKNKLIYGDLTISGQRKPQSVRTSDEGTPENTTSGIATELSVLEGADPILDIQTLGDLLVVYGKRTIATMTFLGSPLVWFIRTAISEIGPIGGQSIIPFGDFHFFIGRDRAYQFNGETLVPFADHVFREVLRRVDSSRFDRLVTHVDEQNGDAHFVMPFASDGMPTLTSNGTVIMTTGFPVVFGTGTSFVSDGVEPGDYLYVGSAGHSDPSAQWFQIASVVSNTSMTITENFTAPGGIEVPYTISNVVPGEQGPQKAYTVHYLEDTGDRNPPAVTLRELPATATGFFQRGSTALRFSDITDKFEDFDFKWDDRFFAPSAPFNLFGDSAGFVYNLGVVGHQAGKAFDSFVVGKRFSLDGVAKVIVKRVEPQTDKRIVASYKLDVKVRGSDFADDAGALLASETFDLTHTGKRFVSPRVAARYYEIEFGTDGATEPWELNGYAIETILAGER